MNARQQQQRGGGQRREYSPAERIEWVVAQIVERRLEIETVLPREITYDQFISLVRQAVISNPEVLQCTGPSIVQACCKSAYDGLRLDGREATLSSHSFKVSSNPDQFEKRAVYMPMVFGLRKKVMKSGAVTSFDVTLIYRNEPFRIIRGTSPQILHEQIMDSAARGDCVGGYSVAHMRDGGPPSIDVMTFAEIEAVREVAATQYVWKKNWGEMARKTIARRHSKTLPQGSDVVIDVEAREMFPQFRNNAPALAAPAARPQPSDYRHLEHKQSVQMDFGQQKPAPETVAARGGQRTQATVAAQSRDDQPAQKSAEPPEGWADWAVAIKAAAGEADMPALNALWNSEKAWIEGAPPAIMADVKSFMTDRMTDLAADEAR